MSKYLKYFFSALSQILILVYFYFNLQKDNEIKFIGGALHDYYLPIIFAAIFIFLASNFLIFLITNCHNQKPLFIYKDREKEEKEKEDGKEDPAHDKQVIYLAIGHVLAIIYSFFNVIYFVVLVFAGSEVPSRALSGGADVLTNFTIYFYIGSFFAFTFLLFLHNAEDYRPFFIRLCNKHPWVIGLYYAYSALAVPVYTIFLFMIKMRSWPIKLSGIWLKSKFFLNILGNFAFTIFYSAILASEFYLLSTGDMRDWPDLFFRAIAIFVLFYLPFKVLSIIAEKEKNNIYFEVIISAVFFIAQLLIIDRQAF